MIGWLARALWETGISKSSPFAEWHWWPAFLRPVRHSPDQPERDRVRFVLIAIHNSLLNIGKKHWSNAER